MKQIYKIPSNSLPHIGFIGGDMRLVYAYEYLQNQNFPVSSYGLANGISSQNLLDLLQNSSVLVCGIPFSTDNKTLFLTSTPFQKNSPISIDYFLSCLSHIKEKHQPSFLFAGKIPDMIKNYCNETKIKYHDFLDDDDFALANAVPTAEGAIMEAIALGNTVLENQECLVLGYGKCGNLIAKKLKALSANVTIYTRHPEQKNYFESLGYSYYNEILPYRNHIDSIQTSHSLLEAADMENFIPPSLEKYSYIFNTVPSLLLDSVTLSLLAPHTVIIDIASLPGGVDYNVVKNFPIYVKHTLGIPGKIAPRYAGELIAQTIQSSIMCVKKSHFCMKV